MNKTIPLKWLPIGILFFLGSCQMNSCNKSKSEFVSIHLFTQKIGTDASKPFPNEFKELFLPYSSKDCSDSVIFISCNSENGIVVHRLDNSEKFEIKFDFSSALGKSVSKKMKRMQTIIDEKFEDVSIGKIFTKENSKTDFSLLSNYQDRIVVWNPKTEKDSVSISGKFYPVFRNINVLKAYIADDLCRRYSSGKNFSDYAILYNIEIDGSDGDNIGESGRSGDPFKKQIHDKLMAIAKCVGSEKVYEERLPLANEFNAQYFDAATEVKQYTQGGFLVHSYVGAEAARYVRSLAEQDLCMTDLEIVELHQSQTNKVGLIKIKEFQAPAK